jgi:hypothetical protein
MRTFSVGFRNELEASSSGEVFPIFLTITHPNLDLPLRLVSDVVDYVWQGNTFTGFPFEITLISDEDRPPSARLRVQNVNQRIGSAVLVLQSSPRIQLDVLAASDFTEPVNRVRTEIGTPVVEYSAPRLRLRQVRCDAMMVEGELWSWDLSQEPWPAIRTTKDKTPALYR